MFGHEKSPASSGMIIFILFILLYIYKKTILCNKMVNIYLFIVAVPIFFTGSKIAIVGIMSFVFFNILFDKSRQNTWSKIAGFLLLLILLFIASKSGIGDLHRLQSFLDPIEVITQRGIWWKVEWVDGVLGGVFGMGLSSGHINFSTGEFSYGMAMDNLYLYNFTVLGLIGSALFFLMLFFLLKSYPVRCVNKRIQVSLIFSYLCMGMGGEVFQLSISGLFFWTISGYLIASSKRILLHKELYRHNAKSMYL